MTMKCDNCDDNLTLEKQTVGSQISSDDDKPDGNIYTTKCDNCSHKNPEKVQKLINQ